MAVPLQYQLHDAIALYGLSLALYLLSNIPCV